jgi:hypothetical protein
MIMEATGGEKMRPLKQDLSIFDKFEFEKAPVGVKFLFFRPEGMKQLSMDIDIRAGHLDHCRPSQPGRNCDEGHELFDRRVV